MWNIFKRRPANIIYVKRKIFTEKSTIGELTFDNFKCYTLEDKDRELKKSDPLNLIKTVKVYGQTAIPYGEYEVIINYSNRFKEQMPLLLGVPGFEGIRIHKGNKSADTHGCLLVGKGYSIDWVSDSKVAYLEFMKILKHKLSLGKVFINIYSV